MYLFENLEIIAVIATKNRCDLLLKRAISSIISQSRLPNYLIIIDDSDPEVRNENEKNINKIHIPNCEIIYSINKRTKGASGSWNTAFDLIAEFASKETWIAILDDDDAWHQQYIETCEKYIKKHDLDMVATDIIRIENSTSYIKTAPNTLNAEICLVENSGIQGSNLFLKFKVILEVGGFDEALQSTTDRDMCIRISDLGWIKYARISNALVEHYAETTRTRLSIAGSTSKLEGLSTFWLKYKGRMTANQQEAFIKRAQNLFDWKLPSQSNIIDDTKSNTHINEISKISPISLYIGTITSDPNMLHQLLNSLMLLKDQTFIYNLKIVILDNASPASTLKEVLNQFELEGLNLHLISMTQQVKDVQLGKFGSYIQNRPNTIVSIAVARTMLQSYIGKMMATDIDSFAWLLDDDMYIDKRAIHYLKWLPSFRNDNVGVLIGSYEGASPNPPLNGLRVQMVDIFHNLAWLNQLSNQEILPDRSIENQKTRNLYADYYYDLSRKHTAHLETPYWIEPITKGETVELARKRLVSNMIDILMGQSMTRPLIFDMPKDPISDSKNSVNRGGNTFILDHRSLTQTPNLTLSIQGNDVRRSDMIWAIINQHYRKIKIKSVNFPIIHTVRKIKNPKLDLEKLQAEIMGSALYSALQNFLIKHPDHSLSFSLANLEELQKLFEDHRKNRVLQLYQSVNRIKGLRKAIQSIDKYNELNEFFMQFDKYLQFDHIEKFLNMIHLENDQEKDIKIFLTNLQLLSDSYALASCDSD